MYMLVIDRFARTDGNDTYCDLMADWFTKGLGGGYCGGNLQGLIDRLDYIKGMNFDCIWITPPIASHSFMGYDAIDLFGINPHFGYVHTMKNLADELHARGMCLVVDIVLNHMAPLIVNEVNTIEYIHPFNRPEYYHQVGIKPGETFDHYIRRGPATALPSEYPDGLNLRKALQETGLKCGPTEVNMTHCNCNPGNYAPLCPHFDETILHEGWLGTLADLNQSHPYVKERLLSFVRTFRDVFDADAFRLDTAIYLQKDFLAEVQEDVDIEIIGETTVSNMSFHASFQHENGKTIVKGLLNFPVFYWVPHGFCGYKMFGMYSKYDDIGTWFPEGADLTMLGDVMNVSMHDNTYQNLDMLANFVDTHDEYARLWWYCKYDTTRIKNALAWVMMARGIPIIYYGTEQRLDGHQSHSPGDKGADEIRESMWQTKYDTSTDTYAYIGVLNTLRHDECIRTGVAQVVNRSTMTLVFTRESQCGKGKVWMYVNNAENTTTSQNIVYCPAPPQTMAWYGWFDVISGQWQDDYMGNDGCYSAPDRLPKMLVVKPRNGEDKVIV